MRTTQPNTPLLPALSFCGGDVGYPAPGSSRQAAAASLVPRAGLGEQHLPWGPALSLAQLGWHWLSWHAVGSWGTCCDGCGAALIFEPSSGLSRSNPECCSIPPRPWYPGLRHWRCGLHHCPSTWPPAPCRGPGAGTLRAAFWVENATHSCGSWGGCACLSPCITSVTSPRGSWPCDVFWGVPRIILFAACCVLSTQVAAEMVGGVSLAPPCSHR